MKKEKKEKPIKTDQWTKYRRAPLKSVTDNQGPRKAYEMVGEYGSYEIKTPWGTNLKWPEGAAVEFWLMLQDLRELLTREYKSDKNGASQFAIDTLNAAQKKWQDRVQKEYDDDMIELGKVMKELTKKGKENV